MRILGVRFIRRDRRFTSLGERLRPGGRPQERSRVEVNGHPIRARYEDEAAELGPGSVRTHLARLEMARGRNPDRPPRSSRRGRLAPGAT